MNMKAYHGATYMHDIGIRTYYLTVIKYLMCSYTS